jgi:hypothetical protein
MKTVTWALVLGVGNGARAGIIGALAYVVAHGILRLAWDAHDPGYVIFSTLIGFIYGIVIGGVLGAIVGSLSGPLLAIFGVVRVAFIVGIIFGGIAGWFLGAVPPFPPETGTFADPVALQWYHLLTRLLATLCGALGGFLGGRHFWTSFRKRVT